MYLKDSKTVVIKIGSSLLINDKKIIREKWLSEFAKDIQLLQKLKKNIILVSSGAIALGCKKLKLYFFLIFVDEEYLLQILITIFL